MDLKLTDAERLILANQYEILSKLDEDTGYSRLATQLRDGHEWLYRQAFNWLSPVMPARDANLVLNVLELHSALLFSFNALPDPGSLTKDKLAFEGFDANDDRESVMLGFTNALSEQGRFSEILEGRVGLKSHGRTIPQYERMLAAWEAMDLAHELSKAQIEMILAAKRHPR
jgi:uncharacterized protein